MTHYDDPPIQLRRSTVLVLVSAAVLLTLRQYIFTSANISPWLRPPATPDDLYRLAGWTIGQAVSYLIIPALIVVVCLRQPLSDYGLKLRGALTYWWAYLAMYAVMFPLIMLMSMTQEFQATYPFYQRPPDEPLWPRFWIWELMYWSQFVSLEFFFRGYLIHGTRRDLGPYSIFVSMIPYCMIHYGKPLPETLGSIVAGLILGTMSYWTRSIWLGAALHIGVAVTMDLAAL